MPATAVERAISVTISTLGSTYSHKWVHVVDENFCIFSGLGCRWEGQMERFGDGKVENLRGWELERVGAGEVGSWRGWKLEIVG